MEKLPVIILMCAVFLLLNKSSVQAGDDKNLFEQIFEKIEEKYKNLRESSPFVKAKGKEVAQSIRFIQPEDKVIEDYSKLKQIALVRHGEPDIEKTGKFTKDEANYYLKCYDSVCIIVPDKPFFDIHPNENVKVFSSPINRAYTTAQYLCGTDQEITTSKEFREFETKIKKSNSKRRFPIKFWTTGARVKWMLGIGNQEGIESFSDAKKRAREAAETLVKASESNPKVLLTAHGFLNRYIKKNLKDMGWKVVEDTGSNYLGTTILVKIEDKPEK